MKPLALLDARAVRFVLVDIDDTLTTRASLARRPMTRSRRCSAPARR